MVGKERVSVIIPVYNRPRRLRDAVMSVLLQSYSQIEIVIVDDGSTDSTRSVVQELSSKWQNSVVYLCQPNSGPGSARELGTSKASGFYIQYLDSDDLLMPDKLKYQVKALLENQEADICYGISLQEDHSYQPALVCGPMRDTAKEWKYLFPRLLNQRWWTTSTPLYRSGLVRRIGSWTNLLNEEDWEFDGRAGRNKATLVWIPHIVSTRRINIGSDHLSYGGYSDPRKLRDRVSAKQTLYECALICGLTRATYEMKTFARECFMLARQCAELGLVDEAAAMFTLSRNASGRWRRFGIDFLVYNFLSYFIGWYRVGTLSKRLRSVLK